MYVSQSFSCTFHHYGLLIISFRKSGLLHMLVFKTTDYNSLANCKELQSSQECFQLMHNVWMFLIASFCDSKLQFLTVVAFQQMLVQDYFSVHQLSSWQHSKNLRFTNPAQALEAWMLEKLNTSYFITISWRSQICFQTERSQNTEKQAILNICALISERISRQNPCVHQTISCRTNHSKVCNSNIPYNSSKNIKIKFFVNSGDDVAAKISQIEVPHRRKHDKMWSLGLSWNRSFFSFSPGVQMEPNKVKIKPKLS